MPLLAVAAGKAMPDMAIGYITRKDKAKYIDVQNLFIDEDLFCSVQRNGGVVREIYGLRREKVLSF